MGTQSLDNLKYIDIMSKLQVYPSIDKIHSTKKYIEVDTSDIVEVLAGYENVTTEEHFIVVKLNKKYESCFKGTQTETAVIYDEAEEKILESRIYNDWLRNGISAGFGF